MIALEVYLDGEIDAAMSPKQMPNATHIEQWSPTFGQFKSLIVNQSNKFCLELTA